jgi:hypothetical protein
MNCIFKVYAGFCLLLKNCKCSKIGSYKTIDECNPFTYLL